MLEVVQDDQRLTTGQMLPKRAAGIPAGRLLDAESRGDGRRHEVRLLDGLQTLEEYVPAIFVEEHGPDLDGHARLARAAGAGEGEEAHLLAREQGCDRR